jgi:putative addiction module killer protein
VTNCIQLDTFGHEHAHSVIRLSDWLNSLKDQKAKARILHRLSQAALGNFGDCEPVGEGVSEMRIHHGPGFRVYFVRHGAAVYVLLCGGDKSSQRRDIARAKRMARELKESGR